MTKNINIELTDEEFEELKRIKEHLGTTWEHMLKRSRGRMRSFRLMKCSECGKEVELHRGRNGKRDSDLPGL